MDGADREHVQDSARLSAALKAVRKERRMSRAEVANAMHMAPRTYARFESGETRPNLDYINRFAVATRSDPQAIHLAVTIGSPELARRACDNQLGTIFVVGLAEFNEACGDRIKGLDSRTIIAAVLNMFDWLTECLPAQNEPADAWLEKGKAGLSARRPRPGR